MKKRTLVTGMRIFLASALVFFSILTYAVLGAETNLQATVQVLGPFITINAPIESQEYNATIIILDVSLRETAKFLYYTLNNNGESRLCRACSDYYGTIEATEGENLLVLRAQSYDREDYYTNVSFFVNTSGIDLEPPVIHNTYPFKEGNGNFGVKYTEDNLRGITLYYGSNLENSYEFENCNSGNEVWCYDFVDISLYEGQRIFYQFEVRNHFSSTLSKKTRIKIDTSTLLSSTFPPTSLNSSNMVSLNSEILNSEALNSEEESFLDQVLGFFRNLFGI